MSDEVRKQIQSVAFSVKTGMSGLQALLQKNEGDISDLREQLHVRDRETAATLGKLQGQFEAISNSLDQLKNVADRLSRLEGNIQGTKDATGAHRTQSPAPDPELERKRLAVEKKKAADQARTERWKVVGTAVAAGLPGLIALIAQLFGLGGGGGH